MTIRAYYLKHREELLAKNKEYRTKNPRPTNKEYQREYYLKNRDKELAYAKERYLQKREAILAYAKEWRKKHPKYGTRVRDEWRKNNPERHKIQKKRAREKRRSNPQNRICESISQNIKRYLKYKKQSKSWKDLVDFTGEELIKHLEKQFQPGMSWENYGEWHIDHIIPVTAFNFTSFDDIDFKRCWTLKNLRPMWASENIRKGNRLEKPFQPALALAL